jgi:prepilin-type N-terminal cleavage/methylation domain-containing protein
MNHTRSSRGFSLIELVIAAAVMALLMTLAITRWNAYMAQQRIRYGTTQVATDLRHAQERAKAERMQYTVNFTASSGTYSIVRSDNGFRENAQLPDGVSPTATRAIVFSAFGKPIDPVSGNPQAYTISVRNTAGTGTATVNASGGITYQEP